MNRIQWGDWLVLMAIFAASVAVGCGGAGGMDPNLNDGSVRDASVDGGDLNDGGLLTCDERLAFGGDVGGVCRGVEQLCNGDILCLPEFTVAVGGTDDPITDYPPGENEPFDVPLFPGGYCSLALATNGGGCTTFDEAACHAECATCVPFFTDANVCLKRCVAEANTNSACREGYQCSLFDEACDSGCASDDDCRVRRQDTDENGMIEVWDPEMMTGDHLVYDTDSTFFCSDTTYRCEHAGTPEAQAGDMCTDDEQCEANGECLREEVFDFPGGYCTKFRCDLAGNECAGDATCQVRGFGIPICAEACKVAAGATPGQPATYLGNTQGCREGYTCLWNGIDPATASINGACVPGVFNEVASNNIGSACVDDDACYSPFGQGGCDADFGCTVFDCAVPGMPTDVCGDMATCVIVGSNLAVCLEDCTSADDCLPGAACVDLDTEPMTPEAVCFPVCADSTECRAGEVCDVSGTCVTP